MRNLFSGKCRVTDAVNRCTTRPWRNTFTLKLDQVFVDLRIAPSGNPQRPGMDSIAVKELTGNRPIWEFLRVKRGKNEAPAALAVVGPPGCGKTTLLQHVALTLAANRQRRYRLRAY